MEESGDCANDIGRAYVKSFKQFLEMVLMKQSDPPIMILSNPKRKELANLEDFSEVHDLSISGWMDQLGTTEWRMIYDLTSDEWFVWSGFQAHGDILKRFRLPEKTSAKGYVNKVGNEFQVEVFPFDISKKNAELAIERITELMKKNKLKGKVEMT